MRGLLAVGRLFFTAFSFCLVVDPRIALFESVVLESLFFSLRIVSCF
jgi:hypothetical protein